MYFYMKISDSLEVCGRYHWQAASGSIPGSPIGGASHARASGRLAEVRGNDHVRDDIYTTVYQPP